MILRVLGLFVGKGWAWGRTPADSTKEEGKGKSAGKAGKPEAKKATEDDGKGSLREPEFEDPMADVVPVKAAKKKAGKATLANGLSLCDQCLKPVEPRDSARRLDERMKGKGKSPLGKKDRHILKKDGCPGSPTRNQYLKGQPKDGRSGAVYHARNEKPYQQAYAAMQAEAEEEDSSPAPAA